MFCASVNLECVVQSREKNVLVVGAALIHRESFALADIKNVSKLTHVIFFLIDRLVELCSPIYCLIFNVEVTIQLLLQ